MLLVPVTVWDRGGPRPAGEVFGDPRTWGDVMTRLMLPSHRFSLALRPRWHMETAWTWAGDFMDTVVVGLPQPRT